MTLDIKPIKAFSDNYLWLGSDSRSNKAFVVDPGDAAPVQAFLDKHALSLSAILITHHHPDHTGGVDALKSRYQCPVYGPDSPNIPQVDNKLREGDRFSLWGHSVDVIEVPGHTLDHIAYFIELAPHCPALFCGDTLFAGGCGRLFEGTPQQMLNSLNKIAQLPENTLIYCAHEYTLANLNFAIAVEPHNIQLANRIKDAKSLREQNLPTVPSRLAEELATNPFMRSGCASVREVAATRLARTPQDDAEIFAAIRQWKDNF
ncbi:MAG: hydroxyacylglutathione hydrolase [Porticoccaceae bacterium]|nr:hydroxyacylglutathione hydrolase [Porticoccaceae bacterium]